MKSIEGFISLSIVVVTIGLYFWHISREYKKDVERAKKRKLEKARAQPNGGVWPLHDIVTGTVSINKPVVPDAKTPIKNFFVGVLAQLAFLLFCLIFGYIVAYNLIIFDNNPWIGLGIGFCMWAFVVFIKKS